MFIRNNRSKLNTFAYGVFKCCAKKRNVFYLSFSKRLCRSVHTECCEHEVIYKQQDIKGSISL